MKLLLTALVSLLCCGASFAQSPAGPVSSRIRYANYDGATQKVRVVINRPLPRSGSDRVRQTLSITLAAPAPHAEDPAFNGTFSASYIPGSIELTYAPPVPPTSGNFFSGGIARYARVAFAFSKPPPKLSIPHALPAAGDCPDCTGTMAVVEDAGTGIVAPVPPWTFDPTGYYLSAAANTLDDADPSLTLTSALGFFDSFSTVVDAQAGIEFSYEEEFPSVGDLAPGISFNQGGFVNETTGYEPNAVTGDLTYHVPGTKIPQPCLRGAVIFDSNNTGDVGCDGFLVYAPNVLLPPTPHPYNLSSGAIEGFYYADAPWPSGSYANSLLYLFSADGPILLGGTVVANPLYPLYENNDPTMAANTIGSLDKYAILGTPMPDESSQLDFRAGHFGQISHNWPHDPYTGNTDAAYTVCLADKLPNDQGAEGGANLHCQDTAFYSAVPGWNARTEDGDTMVSINHILPQRVWSAGIKSVIDMPTYVGGMGDTFLINADSIFKPAWTGQGDEGLKLIRLSTGEAKTYTGTVSSYTQITHPTGQYAANALVVTPTNTPVPAQNQEVGVGHPMLDMSVSVSGTGTNVHGNAASVLTDTGSPMWPASVAGCTVSAPGVTVPRLPNSGEATYEAIKLQGCNTALSVGQMVGLCGGGVVTTGGGTGSCVTNYEQAMIVSVPLPRYCDGETCFDTIGVYVRFSHLTGSGVNAGGLVGSYISFGDYYNSSGYNNNKMGPTQIPQLYVQNVFSNTSNTLTFGIMRAGYVVSYPEMLSASEKAFPYTLWRGGTVYDVRDPSPSSTKCAGKMVNSADGCYFIIEDNNTTTFPPEPPDTPTPPAWPAGGAVAQTNYQAANWLAMYSSETVTNPYAAYTALQVSTPAGTGAGYRTAVGLRVGGIADGFTAANAMPILQAQTNLSPTGIYIGPTLLEGNGYFGEGWYMGHTPYGTGENKPDLIHIAYWTQCFQAEPGTYPSNCSPGTGTTTYDYQRNFRVLDIDASPDSGGDAQNQQAYRTGQYQFTNYGTIFSLAANFYGQAAVTTPSLESGSASNTDLAGELSFDCPVTTPPTPCQTKYYVFQVNDYNTHPACLLQPEFDITSTGAPWPTYVASVYGVTLNSLSGVTATGNGTITFQNFGNATDATATAQVIDSVIQPVMVAGGAGGYNATAGPTSVVVTGCVPSSGHTLACMVTTPMLTTTVNTYGAFRANLPSQQTGLNVNYVCVGRKDVQE